MAYNLKKEIIGSFLYFVESGKDVDGTTVSNAAYPDVEPITNWNSLGCIQEFTPEPETETDSDYCPSPSGGYIKEDDTTVVKDVLKFTTRAHSEPVWRMMFGLKNEIVNGTAQTPFDNKRRFIEGWLKVQGRGADGSDRVVMNVWGRLRIDQNPKWSKDPTKPGLSFEVLYSAIATLEPNGIA